MDHPLGAGLLADHVQSPEHEQDLQVVARRPANHAPTEGVDDDGQIEKSPDGGGDVGVSSPREYHPQALAEPDVNLSAHPAPTVPAAG